MEVLQIKLLLFLNISLPKLYSQVHNILQDYISEFSWMNNLCCINLPQREYTFLSSIEINSLWLDYFLIVHSSVSKIKACDSTTISIQALVILTILSTLKNTFILHSPWMYLCWTIQTAKQMEQEMADFFINSDSVKSLSLI